MDDKEFLDRIGSLERNCLDSRSGLDLDGLLDVIPALCAELSESALRRSSKNIELFLNKFEMYREQIVQCRVKKSDFEVIKVIGRGAFGEVQVVRHRRTQAVFAMKTLSKCETIKRIDSAMFWEEREIMMGADSDWIVRLVFAFQDPRNLYYVMEYLPGGDVATLMSMEAVDERMARFYTAEVTLALDVVHNLGFIHRDIKPDNMLLDARGHLKLADFGTCMRVNKDGYVICDMAVGTPDYISPEVLTANNVNNVGGGGCGRYGRECDWWSVGIFLYEMLYNETPFYAESLVNTYANIMNHKEKLQFPHLDDGEVSNEAKDLIRRFLTDRSERLGRNGAAEIKAHSFFLTNEWNWDNIRNTQAPFIPNLKSEVDTQYFDHAADQTAAKPPESFLPSRAFVGHHLPFVGFTFNSQYKLTLGPVAANGISPRKSLMVGGDLETKLRQESAHRVEAEAKLQQLTKELDRLNSSESQLRNDLKSSQRECNRVAIELNDIQIKYDTESEAYRKTDKRLRELEKEKLQLSELALKSQSNASHVVELERELREARDQLHAEADSTQKLRRQIADVQRQLSSLQSSQEAAEHQLREADEKRQAAERERARLVELLNVETSSKAEALRKVDELKGANSSLSNELQRVQSHESELAEALTQAKADLASMQKMAANNELEMTNLKLRIDKETRRINTSSAAITTPTSPSTESLGLVFSSSSGHTSPSSPHAHDSLLDLQRRLDAELLEHQRTEHKLSEAQRLINELSIDKTTLTQDKKQAEAEVSRLTVELEAIRGRVDAQQSELSAVRRDLDDAYRMITVRKREAEEAEDKLKRANVEKQRVVEDLSKTREALRESQAKVKDVEQQLDTERMLNQMVKSQKREAVEECEQQKRRADDLEAVRHNLLSEHESQSAELKQLRKRADGDAIAKALAESQIGALRRDREDLYSQVAELKTALIDQKARDDATILDWSTRYDEVCSNVARLQMEAENKDAEIRKLKSNLETEQAAKRATIEKLAGAMGQAKGAKSSAFGKTNFEAEYKRKKEECLRLQKELKEDGQKHHAEIQRFQRENDLLREQLSEETQRTHRFQAELESRQADITALELRLKQMQMSSDAISLGSSSEQTKENGRSGGEQPQTGDVHHHSASHNNHQLNHNLNSNNHSPATPPPVPPPYVDAGDGACAEADVVSAWLSIPKGGNLKKNGWMRVFAILTTKRLMLFESENARNDGTEPVRNIELDRFYHVRKVNQGDVCRADPENIPKIFQVMYDPTPSNSNNNNNNNNHQQQQMTSSAPGLGGSMSNASLATLAANAQATMSSASLMTQSSISMSGSSSSGLGDIASSPSTSNQQTPSSMSGDQMVYKAHQLIKMPAPRSGQESGSCDFCHRAFGGGGITAIFSKWSVVQCKTCHSKFHKEHIDKKEETLPQCKVHAGGELAQDLLIMAATPEEQNAWVDRLLKRIPKRGKPSQPQQQQLPHASQSIGNGSKDMLPPSTTNGSSFTTAATSMPVPPPGSAPATRRGSNLSNSSITGATTNGGTQRPISPAAGAPPVFAAPLAMPPSQLPYALPSATTPRSRPAQSPVPMPRKGLSAVPLSQQQQPSAPSTPSSLLSPKHV